MDPIEQVPAADWEGWVDANAATVVDVREPFEWELGTLSGARLIRMSEIPEHVDELRAQAPLLLVCRSGARSNQVAEFLAANGLDRVANMAGGMKALGLQD